VRPLRVSCDLWSGRPPLPVSIVNVTDPRLDGCKRAVMLRQPGTCALARDHALSDGTSSDVARDRRASPEALRGPRLPCPASARPLPCAGISLPVSQYTRLFAQGYDITTPLRTMTNNGAAHQIPMTLCQLNSRALPDNPPRNDATDRRLFRDQV